VRSAIQAVGLCDSLHFQLENNVEFKSDTPDWIPGESLVSKAAGLIRQVTGCTKGVTIEVNKRIPLLSGLGGDSSDAAAVMRGLNKLWGLGLSLEDLLELAAQLSSDASFFLVGGTALAEGRGEMVTPLPPLPHRWVVLMLPPVLRKSGKTKKLYDSLQASNYTGGQITDKLVNSLTTGDEVTLSSLVNVFDEVALDNFAGLGRYWEQFLEAGAREVHLAGSGSALFTLVSDKSQARKIYRNLQEQGLESYLSETLTAMEVLK
ncbi:4-(cytidine 5'-diphospho)-2-C-methyl-D-erythritol kinase, partial [Chloroflexota bacterium]